jgi:PAS domain S-box-containing protein
MDTVKHRDTPLDRSSELLRLFDEVEGHAALLMDPAGNVSEWHPCSERLLGYRAAEILGKSFACFYPAEDAGGNPLQKLAAARSQGRAEEEGWRLRKDGSRFWAWTCVTAIRDERGVLVAYGKVIRDLTERRRAATLFQPVVDNADDSIVTIDTRGRILLFNRAAERTFGYSQGEVMGQNVRMLMPEPHQSAHDTYIANYLQTGQPRVLGIGRELTGKRKDGSLFPIQLQVSAFELEEQRHFIGMVRDLTNSKRLEDRLRQSQKLEAVGQLAAGIAHDFNNLVTVICGYSDIMHLRLPAGDPMIAMLEEVREAGNRAAALTQQLLAFSRKQMLAPKVLDLNTVVRRVEVMLRRLIGADIGLASHLDASIGLVKVDPGQLEHVLINLAVNARDAMPSGGQLTIETSTVQLTDENNPPDCRPGEYVLLAVTDTGCGMPPEVKRHVFEPFFTTKEPGKGTGLGLATAYGIVRQSEGQIVIYSEEGSGTTVKVYFPRVHELASEGEAFSIPVERPRGTETVLLAEDEPALRALAEEILQSCGYTVLTAEDGLEAIRKAEEYPGAIDLLISDVVMPHCGGRAVADRVAAMKPGVKVLFVSGYTDDAVVRHGIVEAEAAFLQKPYSSASLAQKAREVLDRAV